MRNEPTAAVPARGSAGSAVTSERSDLAPRGLRSPGVRSVTAPPGSSLPRTGRERRMLPDEAGLTVETPTTEVRMDMLVRGRHVITDPAVGDPGVLEDAAVQAWYNAWLTPDAAEPFYVLNRRR